MIESPRTVHICHEYRAVSILCMLCFPEESQDCDDAAYREDNTTGVGAGQRNFDIFSFQKYPCQSNDTNVSRLRGTVVFLRLSQADTPSFSGLVRSLSVSRLRRGRSGIDVSELARRLAPTRRACHLHGWGGRRLGPVGALGLNTLDTAGTSSGRVAGAGIVAGHR